MLVAVVTLFVALAIPVRLAAQGSQNQKLKHHHYQLIDMGTFGGPNSGDFPLWLGTLNSRGVTADW
jgi:hypothetical protein